MQTNSQKRENIEKTILALLLSRKDGCSLSQLSRDYNEVEGEQIPWKPLGYHSLLNFVHSLSKTVQIEFRNSIPFVKGIASDKTKHVSKLVADQKYQRCQSGRKVYKPSFCFPTTPPPRVLVSTEILTRVICMVNEYPDGVNKDFVLNYIQTEVPHVNIAMSDIEDQLRGLSHRIGQTSNKFFPIRNMARNGDSKPLMVTAGGDEDSDNIINYNDEDDFAFIPSTSMPDSSCATARTKSTSNFIQESVSKYQHEVAEYKTLEYTPIVQSDQNNLDTAHGYNDNVELEIHRESNNPEKSIHKEPDKENSSDNENVDFIVNRRVQFRLEKLIQNNPDGIWCADLPQKYLEEYKFSLNYAEYGFNSVREFASHLSNIFHCVQPYKTGDFMLYYAKREIPSIKSQRTQKVDNLAQLHYIYESDNDVEALPSSLSLDTCKKIIPDGIVTIGETVGQLDVVELANAETPYIEINVVEVFTPSFFWIQLRKKEKVFKTFMNDLHDFYTKNHEKYVMPPVLLEKGLNCVCMYNEIWHRGIIKKVNPNLDVTVMFYDYGTLKTYPPEKIHYLHRMFSIIPAQAIPCGLVNTKPYIGSKWSASATHHFALRTSQIPLIATIATIDTEDNSMLVNLTDTSEEEDVHINDWLVEKKLARHGKMDDKVDMKNMLIYVEENLLYSPEKCYADEVDISKTDEESKNMPLISPQSTLDDTLFVSTAERTLSNELNKLITIEEENLQVRTSKNDLSSTVFSPTKTNTNPFLQDDSQVVSEITPKEFMRLWKENLQLQMQIAATFNILFNKVIKKSDMNIDDNPAKDGNTLNITDNTYTHTNKSIQTVLNDTVSSVANNYNNLKENFDAVCQSLENKGTYKIENVPQGFENINPKFNLDIQNYFLNHNTAVDVPKPLEKLRNNNGPFKETNPFKLSLLGELQILDSQEEDSSSSNRLTPILNENEELVIEHDLIDCKKENSNVQSINHNIPENLFRDASFNHHQYFDTNSSSNANNNKNNSSALNGKSVSTDYTWTMDNLSNNMSKIIVNNPFIRHSINNINETEEHVETNNENVLNTPHCNYNTFAYTPSYLRISSKEHVMDQEHKDNIAPVSCSSLTNKSFVDHNVQTIDKINEETKFFTNNAANFNQATLTYNNNCTVSKGISNYNSISKNDDTNNCVSSLWLPFNSFLPSVPVIQTAQSDINADEGYLSRPSTSHALYTPTFLKQLNNEAEPRQQSLTKNLNEICDIHARERIKLAEDRVDIQCESYGTIYPSYFKENKDIEITCNDSQWQNSSENVTVKDTEVQVNIDNLGVKNLYSKESELRNIWKSPTSKESTYVHKNPICQTYSSAKRKIFYQTIKLPKRTVYLFHHKGEGWLLVDEFMRFTEFQTVSCMLDFLHFVDIHVPFEEIDKNQYSIEYITFFSIFPKTMQDITNDINNLQLISLKSIVKLLTKLKFISQKDINICIMHNAFINKEFLDGSVTHEISLILSAYGQLKQYIENRV
ncbi:protein dopey homolog PFC0245c-like [Colletes gigas]|uniref:protein dopey homolog PFC0245c-like n=1 Tax=Colletes gigas TaxID=935657 RepID=UPI001C9AC7AB|nr:protein dopey homolog PFC0245c-like [Colletes gigas]